MENYIVKENKIIIKDTSNFNIKHILECGQVFLYEKKDAYYQVNSGSELARIYTYEDRVEIECTNATYFENYFDLKTDYTKIKNELSKDEVLKKAIKYGYGMRILRQDKLETLVGFIFSANNNIKRIQNSMRMLLENFGEKKQSFMGEYYCFPSLKMLSKITNEQFKSLGAGYRSAYLVETINYLYNNKVDLNSLSNFTTDKLHTYFTNLKGIGNKVADCICLFGYYKIEVAPVDTWVEKIYYKYFSQNNQKENRDKIASFFKKYFTKLSGYAQQYLFYYEREIS